MRGMHRWLWGVQRASALRAILSVGGLGCATTMLVPLGCAARIVEPAVQGDRPRVPNATASRLRECIDELSGELRGGFYGYEYLVRVDEEGRVLDVETNVRDSDMAGCTRIALRAMTVPDVVFKLRPASALARGDEPAAAGRAFVGNMALAAAAAVALAELIIQAGGITVVFAISVEIVKDVLARKKTEPATCEEGLGDCLDTPLADEPGNHHGASLCHACYEQCRDNVWPGRVKIFGRGWQSCTYW